VGGKTITFIKELKPIRSFSHVAIAAFVTALARVELHKWFRRCKWDVFYCDTDSFFTRKRMPTGKGLGELKLEDTIPATEGAVFLLPKTYSYRNSQGKNKTVMKGFPKELVKFQYEDFLTALQGDLMKLRVATPPKFAKFKTALRSGSLVCETKKSFKSIVSTYDKRLIYRHGADWRSKPLLVKRGVVINGKQ
jgi:hypothetical protein